MDKIFLNEFTDIDEILAMSSFGIFTYTSHWSFLKTLPTRPILGTKKPHLSGLCSFRKKKVVSPRGLEPLLPP